MKQNFEFLYHLIDGERLLSVLVGTLRFSAEKPLDFHDTTFSVLPSLFKMVEILNKVVLHQWKSSSDQWKDFNHMFVIFLIYAVVFIIILN